MRQVCRRLEGAFTLVVAHRDHPGRLVAARRNSPLVLGVGVGETFLASDVAAFVEHTRDAVELGQDQIVMISGADIVVMIHPDYPYDSRLIPVAVEILRLGICDCVLGSRIRTRKETLAGGMPVYKYISNRFLTIAENVALGQNLGDFHSGFRAYSRKVLETIPFERNSNDFVFDTQFLTQAVSFGFNSVISRRFSCS
jgi:glycosyltransferase involved in cell wall biosynthesis